MSATLPAICGVHVAELPASGHLFLQLSSENDRCVVRVVGELDAAGRDPLVVASTAGSHPMMVIDLSGVTFMDCSGYGSLVVARRAVELDGRSLTIRGQTGQPARLFELIAALEDRRCSRDTAGTAAALPGLRV